MLSAPDYSEPAIGWRVWDVVDVRGELRLSSLLYPAVWQPRREASAVCRRSLAYLPWERMALHEAPAVDCVCGIYGGARPIQAVAFLGLDGASGAVYRVLGRVSLWGRVVRAEAGSRAEFGYPEHIYVPEPSARARVRRWRRPPPATAVADALGDYGVPVELIEADALVPGRAAALLAA